MEIKVKYVRDIKPLEKIEQGDWIDLRCGVSTFIRAGEIKAIPLGVVISIPEGYEAIIAPRSSTSLRYGLLGANGIGIIDNSYCGEDDELHFIVYATRSVLVKAGERICQFRIVRNQPDIDFVRVDMMGTESRGGLGSTGGE